MTIGDFSRAVRLTAKALRFYHRSGLLTPAVVDEHSGYRLYAPEQIADARVVRTLRGLDLPVESVREVLAASRVEARAALLAEHLDRMQEKLEATQAAVASLRALIEPPSAPIRIAHRREPERRVIAIREPIALTELNAWFARSVAALQEIAARLQPEGRGSFGGVWPNELFVNEHGVATVFFAPEGEWDDRSLGGAATVLRLPAVDLAVAVHEGPDETVPGVYAALGEYVTRHEIGTDAPARETYLTGFPSIDECAVTEIGWPVFRISR
jgi:DNA-binding transcriptional MerR regulator